MENIYTRTIQLLGNDKTEKIKELKICIVGVGGVGSAVAEMLARTGVGNLTIIDHDTISPSNLNRQIVALNTNINEPKVFEMKKRINCINHFCHVTPIQEFLTADNIKTVIVDFDFVIDCIDTVNSKVDLIKFCKYNKIPIISALGTGNRKSLPEFVITDIFKTTDDPLARILRKKLREKGVESLDVCISKHCPDIKISPPSSVVWQPVACASMLVAFVINNIFEK